MNGKVLRIFCLVLASGFYNFLCCQGQEVTFGDLIPIVFLPWKIDPYEPVDCQRYFRIADSINLKVYSIRGINPVPINRCGNDTSLFAESSVVKAVEELNPGTILVRLIIDRSGRPYCCKVYLKDSMEPGNLIESALSKLTFPPVYKNGNPVPAECRFVYDLQSPGLRGRKIIE